MSFVFGGTVWSRRRGTVVLALLFAVALMLTGAAKPADASQKLLTVDHKGGEGVVTSDPSGINCSSGGLACSMLVDEGTVVTLTATPHVATDLVGWSGDCHGQARTCEVVMDRDRSVDVRFTDRYDAPPPINGSELFIIMTGEGAGKVSIDPAGLGPGAVESCESSEGMCVANYPTNSSTTVNLTVDPAVGSVFTGWGGACQSLDPCTVEMNTRTRTVWVNFSTADAAQPALVVHREGNALGRVTSDPAGIDCRSECEAHFSSGTDVVLTAEAGNGATFLGWNGACTGMAKECKVKMDRDRAVWATFGAAKTGQVLAVHRAGTAAGTVTSDPPGIDCGNDCLREFMNISPGNPPQGPQVVTLTADPDPGQVFAGWSGACVGTDPVCEVTMDGPKAVWATFMAVGSHVTTPLAVIKVGSGQGRVSTTTPGSPGPEPGIDCGNKCYGSFSTGATVPLTATPEPGSVFTGWNGACSGLGDCSVKMNQSKTVWASFTRVDDPANRTLTVFKAGEGNGNVVSDPAGIECQATGGICEAEFTKDSWVTLRVTPKPGSAFMGWSGDCTGLGDCTVKMGDARSVWATFSKYDPNDPGPYKNPPLQVYRTGDGAGSVSSSPTGISCDPDCFERFTAGDEVTLTATPDSGSVFMGWAGDCEGSDPTCELTMDGPRAAWALFAKYDPNGFPPDLPPLAVFRTGPGAGSVSSSPGTIACDPDCFGRFAVNTQVTLTATPKPGSVFAGWSGDCDGVGDCTVKMDGPKAVWARFVPDPGPGPSHVLTVTKSTTGSGTVTSSPAGIECGSTCSAAFAENAKVTLTATADSGSVFSGWSGACTGAAVTCEVTMDQARTVTATFTAVGPGPGPGPKPPVPVNPPNDGTAIFDPVTGKLKIRLKCTNRFRPRCLKMVAWAVTGKGKKAKQMTKGPRAKVKNRRAGKWKLATLTVKPKFRQRVADMGKVDRKSLWVRIKVTGKKKVRVKVRRKGKVRWVKRRTVTIHHRYRVLVR